MTQRRISGRLVLPATLAEQRDARAKLELRDVTLQDAPSVHLLEQAWAGLHLRPGLELPFDLLAPEVPAGHSHALQARVEVPAGSGAWRLVCLTTVNHALPSSGPVAGLRLTLTAVP